MSLVQRPEEIKCVHFSALPKPGDLLLGNINEESCGHIWPWFENDMGECNDADRDLKGRAISMADKIFDYNDDRATHFGDRRSNEEVLLLRNIAQDLTFEYCEYWFDVVWPNMLEMLYGKIMNFANSLEDASCRFCSNDWDLIGCPQHVLFTCPSIQWVALHSWHEHGPGTHSNIDTTSIAWVGFIRQMAANPFQKKTGLLLRIKLAYLNEIIAVYTRHAELDLEVKFAAARESKLTPRPALQIMNEYKELCKQKHRGDINIALYRMNQRPVPPKVQWRDCY
jgi:hypothetical protein